MKAHFYHATVLCALAGAACGRPTPSTSATTTSSPQSKTIPQTPASTSGLPATPTADAIAEGRAIVERIRSAGGGAKLTALRSFIATGTSSASAIPGVRSLAVRALFPGLYRQEETPRSPGGRGFAVGVEAEGLGWILGARLGGDGRSADPKLVRAAYDRAGSQAMAAFLAGVNTPWLVDSGQFTPVAGGKVAGGDDRDLFIVSLEGPHGRAGRLLIDPGTNLPRRFVEPPQPTAGGEAGRNDLVFTYSDFKTVDGLQLPHTITRHVGTNQTTWSIAKYELNPKLTPRDFTPRAALAAK